MCGKVNIYFDLFFKQIGPKLDCFYSQNYLYVRLTQKSQRVFRKPIAKFILMSLTGFLLN